MEFPSKFFEGKRDVILFCIDCSESMHELRDDPNYEDVKTSHLFTALDAAVQIQKKKVIVGPNDSFGIVLFNTVRFALSHSGFAFSSSREDPYFRCKKSRNRNQEELLYISAHCAHKCPGYSRPNPTVRWFVMPTVMYQ